MPYRCVECAAPVKRLDRGAIAVLGSAITFGTYGVLGKWALAAGVEPFALLFWRFAAAAVILWLLAGLIKEQALPPRMLPALAGLGVAYAAMSWAYLHTMQTAGVSYAVLLFYAYPVVVAVIERLHGRPLRFVRVAAIVLAMTGVVLLVHAPATPIAPLTLFIGICAALAYGVYIFYGSGTLRGVPAMRATSVILGTTTLVMLPFAAWSGITVPDAAAAFWVTLIALCVTTVPIGLLNIGMRKTGPAKAAILGTMEPLTAVVLAVIFLGEQLRGVQIAGAVLIAAATLL